MIPEPGSGTGIILFAIHNLIVLVPDNQLADFIFPVIVTTLYLGTVTDRLPVEEGFSFLRSHFTLELDVYETMLSKSLPSISSKASKALDFDLFTNTMVYVLSLMYADALRSLGILFAVVDTVSTSTRVDPRWIYLENCPIE